MTDTNPFAFFERVCETYERAERAAGGVVDRYYTIGGYTIRLRFAGPALVSRITPALEHLAASPTPSVVNLTICLWDSVSTLTSMPPCPWKWDDYMARGELRGFSKAGIHAAAYVDVCAISMLDEARNLGVYWIRNACHVPTYERGAPLRAIIHWWMRQRGRLLVHAGAVGRGDDGLLLVGKGGSGKSTAALVSLLCGWRYAADDYCLLAANGMPYAFSLYNTAKLSVTHLENFPSLQPAISNHAELPVEKALLYLHQHRPSSLTKGLSVRAILLPRVTGRRETVVTSTTPAAALQALAPSSLFQLPGAGQSEFLALADFVKRVPCYHLELGTEIERIPETMQEVLLQ